jgi:hypothetical protein
MPIFLKVLTKKAKASSICETIVKYLHHMNFLADFCRIKNRAFFFANKAYYHENLRAKPENLAKTVMFRSFYGSFCGNENV